MSGERLRFNGNAWGKVKSDWLMFIYIHTCLWTGKLNFWDRGVSHVDKGPNSKFS